MVFHQARIWNEMVCDREVWIVKDPFIRIFRKIFLIKIQVKVKTFI